MSLEVTDAEIDQLIATRLPHSLATQIIADPTMKLFETDSIISPPPIYRPRQTKRRSRIYIKVRRYLADNPDWDLKTAVNMVDDLAGGRFLIHYISDINKLYEHICREFKERTDIEVIGECRNCVFTPKESGFRALTQDISIQIRPHSWFPFEMQIMTFLAHDWDQKQHTVYENREDIPASMHQVFVELSDNLYKADQTFDTIRPLLDDFTSK